MGSSCTCAARSVSPSLARFIPMGTPNNFGFGLLLLSSTLTSPAETQISLSTSLRGSKSSACFAVLVLLLVTVAWELAKVDIKANMLLHRVFMLDNSLFSCRFSLFSFSFSSIKSTLLRLLPLLL
uniref:Uncharacterized protein n=1 Tax=Opuntia streptacantha TaxID=393608 RepID=A0A7C9EUI0_OPUST